MLSWNVFHLVPHHLASLKGCLQDIFFKKMCVRLLAVSFNERSGKQFMKNACGIHSCAKNIGQIRLSIMLKIQVVVTEIKFKNCKLSTLVRTMQRLLE